MLSAVATLLQLLRLWFSLPNKPSRDLTVAYLVNKATRGAARTQVSTFKATKAWGRDNVRVKLLRRWLYLPKFCLSV